MKNTVATKSPKKKAPPIQVIQNKDKPVPAQILAQAIVDVAEGMRKVNASRLTRDAIIALIHDKSRIGKNDITIILNNLDQLEHNWLKKVVSQ